MDASFSAAEPSGSESLVNVYLAARWRPGTLAAYRRHIGVFRAWCAEHGVVALPADADTLARYLSSAARCWQRSTLRLAVSAIKHLHDQHGCGLDAITTGGLRGALSGPVPEAIAPRAVIDRATLVSLLEVMPPTLLGKRNRAMLLLGFAAALRPGELVGLDVGAAAPDGTGRVTLTRDGLEVFLHQSKTDPERRGTRKTIPYGCEPCPVAAVKDWLRAAGIMTGVLFPSSRRMSGAGRARLTRSGLLEVVRQAAGLAHLATPAAPGCGNRRPSFTGRSLRSGFVAEATRANLSPVDIANHVGWTTAKMNLTYSRGLSADSALIEQMLEWHRTGSDRLAVAPRASGQAARRRVGQ